MEKKDVYSEFIRRGYIVDTTTLDFFINNQKLMQDFFYISEKMESAGSRRPFIITLDHAKNVLSADKKEQSDQQENKISQQSKTTPAAGTIIETQANTGALKPKLLRTFLGKPKDCVLSTDDVLSIYLFQYDGAKRLIANKLSGNVVSINKIQPHGEFSLIAAIISKSHEDNSVTAQDVTGEVTVRIPNRKEFDDVLEGDVVGLSCENGPDGPTASQVVWPDVALKRKIETPEKESYVIIMSSSANGPNVGPAADASMHEYERLLKWFSEYDRKGELGAVLIYDESSGNSTEEIKLFDAVTKTISKDSVAVVKEPSMIALGGVKMLIVPTRWIREYEGQWGAPENIMINLLKRRTLAPGVTIGDQRMAEQSTFYDDVPDIFASDVPGTQSSTNYKGVSIINTGSIHGTPIFWVVNLKTRDVNKLDLS